MGKEAAEAEPVIGIPYPSSFQLQSPPPPPLSVSDYQHDQQYFYTFANPHQAGMIPSNAIYGDPMGAPIHQTLYRDTPAPFNCVYCGSSGLTQVRSKPSAAAVVGCMMPFMLGICFLCPSYDCLWHKYHYCPSCGNKVADFEKNDPCAVVDAANWVQRSFGLPA